MRKTASSDRFSSKNMAGMNDLSEHIQHVEDIGIIERRQVDEGPLSYGHRPRDKIRLYSQRTSSLDG